VGDVTGRSTSSMTVKWNTWLLSYSSYRTFYRDVWDGACLSDSLIRDLNYEYIYKMDSSDRFVSNIRSQDFMQVSYDALKSETLGTRLYLEFLKLATSSKARYPLK
jgi:hypothetical protein